MPRFGPLASSGEPIYQHPKGNRRPMPKGRKLRADELRAIEEN